MGLAGRVRFIWRNCSSSSLPIAAFHNWEEEDEENLDRFQEALVAQRGFMHDSIGLHYASPAILMFATDAGYYHLRVERSLPTMALVPLV